MMIWAAMVLLLVSGGAIVNIAVAWGITLGHGSVNDVHKLNVQVMQTNRRPLAIDEARWYSANESKVALPRGLAAEAERGTPTAAEATAQRDKVKHPFAA